MSVFKKRITEYVSDKGRALYKPFSYVGIYETFLGPWEGLSVNLLEIGLGFGGSLQMWQEHFGPKAHIYGMDKNAAPMFIEMQGELLTFIHGDQGEAECLKRLKVALPALDVIIDDGSHVCAHQVDTFKALFPIVKPGGLYFVEDTHTSYRPISYGGGYKEPGTFIEFAKRLIDAMHQTEDARILEESPDMRAFCNQVEAVHIFRSMVVIKRKEWDA